MTYLDTSEVGANSIILGGMFFQNFFGVYTNDYSGANTTQSVQFFVGSDVVGTPYVGNQTLPVGTNPWETSSSSFSLTIWEWVLIGLGGLMLIILLVLCITKCCCGKKEESPYEKGPVDAQDVIYQTDRTTLIQEA